MVRRIVTSAGGDMTTLIGNTAVLRSLRPDDFVDDTFGLPTVTDILARAGEARAATRDRRSRRPRSTTASRRSATWRSGMVLEGVVTNVAAFGAFVDVGVHQDGLVHVSAMSQTFVKDPRDVVKSGDIVKVKVLEVDMPRKRISLTLRLDDEAVASGGEGQGGGRPQQRGGGRLSLANGSRGRGNRVEALGSRRPRRGTVRWRMRCGRLGWWIPSGGEAWGSLVPGALVTRAPGLGAEVGVGRAARRCAGCRRAHPCRPSGTTARSGAGVGRVGRARSALQGRGELRDQPPPGPHSPLNRRSRYASSDTLPSVTSRRRVRAPRRASGGRG